MARGISCKDSLAGGIAKLVLIEIGSYADDDGTNAYPSIAKLGVRTGLDEGTVRKCVAYLEANGELARARLGRGTLYSLPRYGNGR